MKKLTRLLKKSPMMKLLVIGSTQVSGILRSNPRVKHKRRKGNDMKMKRYEVKQISNNWYGVYDNVKREYVIESTLTGIKVYRAMFDC